MAIENIYCRACEEANDSHTGTYKILVQHKYIYRYATGYMWF